jgi:hypothetical protein
MKRVLPLAFATGALLAAVPARADLSLGARFGTSGVGIEATQKFSPHLAARFGLSGLRLNLDYTYDDVDYDTEMSVAVGSALLDWHPGAGIFRITAGASYYNALLDISAQPDPTTLYQIGNNTYTGAQIGTLNGEIEYRKFAPYLGVGWDFQARKKAGLGFNVDVGAVYRGKPDDVSLTASGAPTGISTDLAQEVQNIKDDTPTYHLIVSAGLYYRF